MTTSPVLTEQTDPYCLSLEKSAALLGGAPWHRFGVVGDSLSAGVGDPDPGYPDGPWCDRVAATLRVVNSDLSYLNSGQIGQTLAQTLETQLDALLAFEPDLIHLPSGANDIWRRSEPDWDGIDSSLRTLYDRAASTGATITVFTLVRRFVVPAIPGFVDRVRRINDLTRAIAGEHGAIVVDTENHPINDRPDLLSADGIHVAGAGQAVLAAEVVRALARRLAAFG
jgi:lysophospholipase L1-like esterase